MAADEAKVNVRKVDMEVQQVREMCKAAGPHGYIAMSCESLLRVLSPEFWADDREVVTVALTGGAELIDEEDPFA